MSNKMRDQTLYILVGICMALFCWNAVLSGILFGLCEDVLALAAETPTEPTAIDTTIPETEVTESTEVETAPVETIMPEITEPIPLDPPPETTKTPVPEKTEPDIDPYEVELLACVIYQEAGSDTICDECRRRVADVVLNRVADPRFPNTIRGVLTAQGQYGNFYNTGVVWPERANYPGEAHAVARAYRIAEEVLRGHHSELYGKGYVWQSRSIQGVDNIYCCGHYYGR